MNFRYFLLITLILLKLSPASAAGVPDSLSLSDNHNQKISYSKMIKQGIALVKSDSIRKGLILLSQGMDQMAKTEKKDQIGNYTELEIIHLLHVIPTTSDSMQRLFARSFFSNSYNEIFVILKEHHESELETRLFLLSAYNKEEYAALTPTLIKFLSEHPADLNGNILMATILSKNEKCSQSLVYFNKVLQLKPDYARGYIERGRVLYHLKRNEEAEKDLLTALEILPDYSYAQTNLGYFYIDAAKPEKAIEVSQNLLLSEPENPQACYIMGSAHKDMHNNDSALKYLDKAIRINNQYSKAYHKRADIYYSQQRFQEAIDDFSKCIKIDSVDIYSVVCRGDAYFYKGDIEKAKADFGYALDHFKDDYYLLCRMGDCFYSEKEYAKAIMYCTRSIELRPDNYMAMLTRAACMCEMKNYKQAIEEYQNALKIRPDLSLAIGNIGWTYYCLNDFEQCISYSQKAIEMDSLLYFAKFNLALATMRLGKREESKQLYFQYYKEAKAAKYELKGVVKDLQDLVDQNILKEQAEEILNTVFHAEK